jgi:hypothetical protein
MHRPAIPSILTDAESTKPKYGAAECAINPVGMAGASGDEPDMRGPASGLNRHALHHRPALIEACVGDALTLSKTLKDLNPDFLSERAFDPAHAIPEPNDFTLFLDVHWPPPKE